MIDAINQEVEAIPVGQDDQGSKAWAKFNY